MLNHIAAACVAMGTTLALALPAAAQERDDAVRLFEALALPGMIGVLRAEGVEFGMELRDDMAPGAPEKEWRATVEALYRPEAMRAEIEADFSRAMAGIDLDPLLDFFTSDRGARIVGLELSAREALLDDDVEEASKEAASELAAGDDPRYLLVQEFVETNDLIDTNVVGALNSNYAFYTGLIEGGAFPYEMTEDQVLRDVWSQEGEIRASTTEWVYGFLLMAYEPLSEQDLEAYIALSETPEGEALNAAIFAGFEGFFTDTSREMGRLASRFIAGQDI